MHPAFTSNAEVGGGFGEIPGIWIGKFEATGEYTEGDASKVSIKPGVQSLRNMAKNSEYRATVYLAHSKYGVNKKNVEQNKNSACYTGGTNAIEKIYTTNKSQSTTHNSTGVYDLNGGSLERTAGYVNNGNENLGTYGGKTAGDFYGKSEVEQSTSTKYKTVYNSENNPSKDYEIAGNKNKGDAVYETSVSHSNEAGSWFNASAYFPNIPSPFFDRGNSYLSTSSSPFFFHFTSGNIYVGSSFRLVLTP